LGTVSWQVGLQLPVQPLFGSLALTTVQVEGSPLKLQIIEGKHGPLWPPTILFKVLSVNLWSKENPLTPKAKNKLPHKIMKLFIKLPFIIDFCAL
jgi:hypothetical protein